MKKIMGGAENFELVLFAASCFESMLKYDSSEATPLLGSLAISLENLSGK